MFLYSENEILQGGLTMNINPKNMSLILITLLLSVTACNGFTSQDEQPVFTETVPEKITTPTSTSLPTFTPRPTNIPTSTNTPKPSNTPLPTPTHTPTPEPITFSGSGDSVLDFDLNGEPAIIHIKGNESGRYFSVESFDETGESIDLLVNTTDPYDGYRPLDWLDDEYSTRLQVKASGSWTIEIFPIAQSPEIQRHILSIPGTYNGNGDDIVVLVDGTPDLATIKGNAGGNYFGVIGYGDRREFLVNTTSPYEGTVIISNNTYALEIVAEGDWSIEVTAK